MFNHPAVTRENTPPMQVLLALYCFHSTMYLPLLPTVGYHEVVPAFAAYNIWLEILSFFFKGSVLSICTGNHICSGTCGML